MIVKEGYNNEAGYVFWGIRKEAPWPKFRDKLKECRFFGIYDPEPVGAIVLDGPIIHVSVVERMRGKIGRAVKKIVHMALNDYGVVIAPIEAGNDKAIRLAEGLGLTLAKSENGILFYEVRHGRNSQ